MTLVVETGAGLSNAESFASVAEADAYSNGRNRADTWTGLDTDVKEAALRLATDYMQQTYRMGWAGERRTDTQALDWPRYNVPKHDAPGVYGAGAYYSPDIVPEEVKKACLELAFRALSAELAPDIGALKTKAKVGPIEVEYAPGSRQTSLYQTVDGFLEPLLKGSGGFNIAITRA